MADGALALVVLAFAAWRLAHMLAHEAGPWDCLLKMRKMVGIMYDEAGEEIGMSDRPLAKLLSCTWCLSVWTAALMLVLWWLWPPVVWLLAVSGAAVQIDRWR